MYSAGHVQLVVTILDSTAIDTETAILQSEVWFRKIHIRDTTDLSLKNFKLLLYLLISSRELILMLQFQHYSSFLVNDL